jgi:hypothetical protein
MEGTYFISSGDVVDVLYRAVPLVHFIGTPSSPAIIAANARYGFADGSGGRNSTRSGPGLAEYIGMRTAAERLRREYARFTGAS